jgi:hypothetical protein
MDGPARFEDAGPVDLSGVLDSMSVANSKKSGSLQHSGFEYAGAVARIRRSGATSRAGRRSALLSMLTAAYANSSRNGEARAGGGSDRG